MRQDAEKEPRTFIHVIGSRGKKPQHKTMWVRSILRGYFGRRLLVSMCRDAVLVFGYSILPARVFNWSKAAGYVCRGNVK